MTSPATCRPSLADLFITNLRLLDLHRRTDWPNITPSTYSVKDLLGQNQKSRIRCTEWALYRLFELWDAEETREKLQPFFPVLEPLQSINLRAAIFRSLNDVKKNGHLGRETIVRKTMLDECKGDKFLEVLVIFSTAVVRKIAVPVLMCHGTRQPLAQKYADDAYLGAHETGLLQPLVLAHQVSLSTNLNDKADVKAKCQKFAQLLEQKSTQLTQRAMLHLNTRRHDDVEDRLRRMEKHIKDNWPGNSQWPRALLYGDDINPGDLPLKQPFPSVWNVIIRGDPLQTEANTFGLKQELEQRVVHQQSRLHKWRAFYTAMSGSAGNHNRTVTSGCISTQNEFVFTQHQDLRIQRVEGKATEANRDVEERRLKAILSDLRQELEAASRPTARTIERSAHVASDAVTMKRTNTLASTVEFSRPTAFHTRALSGNLGLARSSTAIPLNRVFSPAKKFRLAARSVSATSNESSTSVSTSTASIPDQPIIHERAEPTPPPTPKAGPPECESSSGGTASPVELGQSPADDSEETSAQLDSGEAGSNVASVMNTFSPLGGGAQMSLAERTRQSMSQIGAVEQTHARAHPVNVGLHSPEAHPAAAMIAQGTVAERRTSLLERTQQSLGNLTVDGHNRSRKSLSVRKSRSSIAYPVNQFETPGRPRPEPLRNTTPNEKLFSAEADYTSVFKSRPRIACSPQPSPGEEDLPTGAGAVIYEESEESSMIDDVDEDSWIRSSPLRGRG